MIDAYEIETFKQFNDCGVWLTKKRIELSDRTTFEMHGDYYIVRTEGTEMEKVLAFHVDNIKKLTWHIKGETGLLIDETRRARRD